MEINLNQRLGFILLAIWLILQGLAALLNLTFSGFGVILGLLAIAAGILIFIGR